MTLVAIRCRILPPDIDGLGREARRQGYGSIDRLISEWQDGSNRFAGSGECLFAVHSDRQLVGIGGMTREPSDASMMRMRRFYVDAAMRGRGVGRLLAETLLDAVPEGTAGVTVNAGTADAAAFWLRMGFTPEVADGYTHARLFALSRDQRDV